VQDGKADPYTWEWEFIAPKTGMNFYVQDTGKFYAYTGSAWIVSPLPLAAVPANSSAAGTPGQIAADTSAIYICVSANTWRKVATTTF
jgi:hypothetical protein